MSTIDKRIVEMEFDNKQFEKGVSTSMDTLDKLNKKLELSDGQKGLTNISKAANSIKLDGLESGIEALNKRFSAFGIVGMTVIKNLTEAGIQLGKNLWNNTIGQIQEGGRARAQNIQQAKFMLKGLGISWEDAYDDINYAVKGTAFGLDEAAMAASQLSASGIKLGDDMKSALGGISGLAAMTGSSFTDIARIFTTVAGNGRLMGDQLNQIGVRGINAAATLGKYLDMTEEEVRDATSKGAIDFQTFANAMYDAFYETAKGANELTSGAIANLKAALSRLGEGFQTPWLEFIRDMATAVTPVIDAIKEGLVPGFGHFAEILRLISDRFTKFTTKIVDLKILDGYTKAISSGLRVIKLVLMAVFEVWSKVFGGPNLQGVKDFGDYLGTVVTKFANFIAYGEGAKKLRETLTRIFTVMKEIYEKVLAPVGKVIGGIIVVVGKLLSLIINLAVYLYHITPPLDEIKERFFALINKIQNSRTFQLLSTIFNNLVSAAKDLWAQLKDLAIQFYNLSSVQRIIKGLGNAFEWVKTKAGEAWTYIKTKFFEVLENLAGTDFSIDLSNIDLSSFDEGLNGILDKLGEFKGKVVEKFEEIKEAIVEWFKGKSIVTIISEKVEEIKQKLKTMKFQDFVDKLKDVKQKIIDFKDKVIEAYNEIKKALGANEKQTNDAFERFKEITGSEVDVSGSDIFKAGGAAAVGGLIYGLVQMFKGLKDASTNILAVKDALVQTMNAVTGCFQEMQKTIKAETIKKIAASVLMIAAAIAILALIPLDRLAKGLGAVGAIGLELWAFTKAMSKIKKDDLDSISKSCLMLAGALWIIGLAVVSIGKLGWEGAMAGALSMAIVMVVMTGVVSALAILQDKFKSVDIEALTEDMILLAISVVIMSIAVKSMGKLEPDQAKQGVIAVIAIMGAIVAFSGAMMALKKYLGDLPMMAGFMLSLAASMVVFSLAVAILGKLKPETMGQGILGIAALLIVIGFFTAVVAASKANMLALGAGMMMFALAMTALVIPVTILGKLKPETLGQGILAVVAMLGAFTLCAKLLGSTGGAGALALMGIAVAMVIMAGALTVLGLMIVPATLGIIAITAALLVLIVAGYLLAPVTVVILAAAAAMLVLGTGVLLAGVGFAAFGSGLLKTAMALKLLSTISAEAAEKIGTVLAAAIAGIAAGIGYLIKAIAIGVVEGIAAFLKALADASLSIAESLVVLGTNLLAVCYALLPLLLDFIGFAIAQVLIVTAKYTPDVVQSVMNILIAILTAINNNIYQIVELIGCIMLNIARALIDYIPQLIIISMEMVIQMIQGFIAALDIYGPVFILAYKNFWLVIGKLTLQLIEEMFGDLPIIGEKITEACENAKQSMTDSIADNNEQIDAARESAREIMEEYTATMGSDEYKTKAGDGAELVTGEFLTTAKSKEPESYTVGHALGAALDKGVLDGPSGGMPQSVFDNYIKPMQDVKSEADTAAANAGDAFDTTFISNIKDQYPGIADTFEGAMGSAGDGLEAGGVNLTKIAGVIGGDAGDEVLDEFDGSLGINSPSKEMEKRGKFIAAGLTNGMDSNKNSVSSSAKSIGEAAINGFKSKEGQSRTVGSNFSQGFALGIRGMISSVSSAAASIGAIALRKLKAAIDSNSPSKETMEIGKFFDAGFAVGIAKYNRPVDQAVENLGTNAIDVMRDSVSKLSSVMGMDLDNIQPTISPVLDLNGIQAGMDGIDSIFSRQQAVKANVEMSDWKSREYSSSLINGSINDMIKKSNENSNKSIDAIKALTEKVDSLEVRLDSGELVGGIVEKMDNAFGTRTMRQMRSN